MYGMLGVGNFVFFSHPCCCSLCLFFSHLLGMDVGDRKIEFFFLPEGCDDRKEVKGLSRKGVLCGRDDEGGGNELMKRAPALALVVAPGIRNLLDIKWF